MTEETMKELIKENPNLVPFKKQDVIEVEILNKTKNVILADLMGLTQGVIHFREWGEEGDNLKPGDKALAYVISMEDESGNVVLSLRRADQQRLNQALVKKYKDKEVIAVRCVEANKGGLLCDFGPIRGFLPVSQLSTSHYPRVAGDKDKILARLKDLIGQSLNVKVIGFDKKTNNPIFSEKVAQEDMTLKKVKKGEILEGKVSGITDFGIFVNLGEFDGLVHISEASWEHVEDLSKLVKIGQKIKVKVIGVEEDRVFLSIKRLLPDPFLEAVKKFKEGDLVKGKVVRLVPFGAFVKLNEVSGLVKLAELSEKKITDPKEIVKEGKSYKFKIIKIDKTARRIDLSLKQAEEKNKTKKAKGKTKK